MTSEISERQRVEEALRVSARLREAQAIAHLGDFFWDIATNAVVWSDELYRIYGLDPDEPITYETYLTHIHPDQRESVRLAVEQALRAKEAFEQEHTIVRPDGELRCAIARAREVVDTEGTVVGLHGTCEDITERKRTEDERRQLETRMLQVQKMESLGILAGGIAHDFNNLLTGILGYAGVALKELPPDSSARPPVQEIEKAAQRAADLTQQLLAYSGRGRFVVQIIDLAGLVQEMTTLLQTVLSKKAALHLDLAPAPIEADATQIRQVVMNLLTNASEALSDQEGHIHVRSGVRYADRALLRSPHFSEDLPEGDYSYFEIADTGSGMTTETLTRIFDPFFTTKFTGRGLGLAAVLGIVRSHQGTIQVTSKPGRGTTFLVLFPRVDPVAASPPEAEAAVPDWRGSGMVLVVDDEESVRILARHILERAGFSVLMARDGHEAIELFARYHRQIAAVLLDLTMPRLDGLEALQELRRLREDVQVLLMSGYSDQEVTNRLAGQNVAGFIQKPFRPAELTAKLSQVLEP